MAGGAAQPRALTNQALRPLDLHGRSVPGQQLKRGLSVVYWASCHEQQTCRTSAKLAISAMRHSSSASSSCATEAGLSLNWDAIYA